MYSFVDTIEYGRGKGSLPAEAVSINDKYIENEIEGYRTLHVVGRELLESEITDRQIGNVDGTQFQSKRNTPRVITVTYSLAAKTPEEFRDKFNKLNLILDQEQSKIVFYDEPDKYFIGTKSSVEEVPAGLLNVVGSFEIYCADPYKHSAVEKTFQAAVNSDGVLEAVIVNEGTEAVPVDYTITHNHENGYIGIVSEHGVIELGSPDEVDAEIRQKSQVLVHYRNAQEMGAMVDGQGILTENFPKNGSFKTVTINGQKVLALDNVGSGSNWHGASKMVSLPADSNGEIGAANFLAQSHVWFETGRVPQTGLLEFVVGDENGQHLASIHIFKKSTNTNLANAIMQIQLAEKKRILYEPNYKSVTAKGTGSNIYIRKSGELFEFYFGGGKYQFRVPSLANKKAATLTIFLGQWGTRGAGNLVSRMYIHNVLFQKDHVKYWYDIPNRYRANSTVYVDGSASKVYVDGVVSLDDEQVGSTYFLAPPGEMKVQFYYSDFSNPGPTAEAKIREAYL
ncbi:phage tail family protein [Faecalicatena sp. AGMB00832]|uniref:Phage tail family protein n=1 Tax=Faecalicatena faecalis TaxID=2726362 RepID=A0ABS6D4R8_9FIRM|nr:distal tail protein Dit [Faecalicatena faecalis]MBU3876481.1 phage tail family protein [Faecalicatena faecalis]